MMRAMKIRNFNHFIAAIFLCSYISVTNGNLVCSKKVFYLNILSVFYSFSLFFGMCLACIPAV
jgi:hypothetical protein